MKIAFLDDIKPPQNEISYRSFLNLYHLCTQQGFSVVRQPFVPKTQQNLLVMHSWRTIIPRTPVLLYNVPKATLRTSLYWKFYQKVHPIFLLSHQKEFPPLHPVQLPPLLSFTPSDMNEASIILSYGVLDESSGHHVALDAFSMLPSRLQKKHPLYIVGRANSQK